MDNRINQYGQMGSGYNQGGNVQGGHSANAGQFQQNVSGNRAASSSRSQGGTRQKLKSFMRRAENAISSPMNSMTNAFNPMAGLGQQPMFNSFGQVAPPPEPRIIPAYDQGVDQAFRNGRGDWNAVARKLAQLAQQNTRAPADMHTREQWRALVQCVSGSGFPPALREPIVTELFNSLPRALADNSLRTGEVRLLTLTADSMPPVERAKAYCTLARVLPLMKSEDQVAHLDALAESPDAEPFTEQKIDLTNAIADLANHPGMSPEAKVRAWVLGGNLVKSLEPFMNLPKDSMGYRQGVNRLDDVVVKLVNNDAKISAMASSVPDAIFHRGSLRQQASERSVDLDRLGNTLDISSRVQVIRNLAYGMDTYHPDRKMDIFFSMLSDIRQCDKTTQMDLVKDMVLNLHKMAPKSVPAASYLINHMSELFDDQTQRPDQQAAMGATLQHLAPYATGFLQVGESNIGWSNDYKNVADKFHKMILNLQVKNPALAQPVVDSFYQHGQHVAGFENADQFRAFTDGLLFNGTAGASWRMPPVAQASEAGEATQASGLTPNQEARLKRTENGSGQRLGARDDS